MPPIQADAEIHADLPACCRVDQLADRPSSGANLVGLGGCAGIDGHMSRVMTRFGGGIATYPDHGTTLETILHAADTALYQANNDGRNRVRQPPTPTPLTTT